jgi:broad specificity phosphatase PhoE
MDLMKCKISDSTNTIEEAKPGVNEYHEYISIKYGGQKAKNTIYTTKNMLIVLVTVGSMFGVVAYALDFPTKYYGLFFCGLAALCVPIIGFRICYLMNQFPDSYQDALTKVDPLELVFPIEELKASKFKKNAKYELLRRQMRRCYSPLAEFDHIPTLFAPGFGISPLDSHASQLSLLPKKTWKQYLDLFTAAKKSSLTSVGGIAKTLYYVPCAESFDALAKKEFGLDVWEAEECVKEVYLDPILTDTGFDDARRLQLHVTKAIQSGLKIDLIVVSPLTRALQTAQVVFDKIWTEVPILALDLCRDNIGIYLSDKRRSTTALKQQFPHVNFHYMNDIDKMWQRFGAHNRESQSDVLHRAITMLCFLWNLEASHIAVVSHEGFITGMMSLTNHPLYQLKNPDFVGNFVVRTVKSTTIEDSSKVKEELLILNSKYAKYIPSENNHSDINSSDNNKTNTNTNTYTNANDNAATHTNTAASAGSNAGAAKSKTSTSSASSTLKHQPPGNDSQITNVNKARTNTVHGGDEVVMNTTSPTKSSILAQKISSSSSSSSSSSTSSTSSSTTTTTTTTTTSSSSTATSRTPTKSSISSPAKSPSSNTSQQQQQQLLLQRQQLQQQQQRQLPGQQQQNGAIRGAVIDGNARLSKPSAASTVPSSASASSFNELRKRNPQPDAV